MVSTLLTNLDLPGYLENTVQCNQRNKGLVIHTVTAACHKNLLKHCNSSLAASQWSLSCLHLPVCTSSFPDVPWWYAVIL